MAELPDKGVAKGPPQGPDKSKLNVGVLVIAALVGMALAAGGYYIMTRRAIAGGKKAAIPVAPKLEPRNAAPVAFLSLAPFVINLADPDHSSFLRVEITLGLDKELPKQNEDAKDSPFVPEVRDTILSVLNTWQSSELLANDGKARLKEQLLSAVRQRVPELGATQVYFTDFLIQR
jgi:flagellar basal body-associated protein FliL